MAEKPKPWYASNITTITLAVCLIVCIVAIVAVVHRDGVEALKGTGLGALAGLLAGALVGQKKINGK